MVVIPDNGTGESWSLRSQMPPGPNPPLQFHPQGPCSLSRAIKWPPYEVQDGGSYKVNSLAFRPKARVCAPDLPAFSHGGFFHN
ncbi:AOC3 [Cervus elaphus hippelaphus]|uniref:AOC3 n=1 Tax=Cervus elaphus hippelaphus TaxID=46360 RepID=A0A212D6Z9_CEREH|nr:AOC3 [Cervus elaphus hippelaphus]